MKKFFQIGVKWCYSVTKSLDLLKILFGNKIVINVKNKSNEKKKITI